MEGLLARLSNYQVFSSIVPGAVVLIVFKYFVVLDVGKFTAGEGLIAAYAIGLALNRAAALATIWDLRRSDYTTLYRLHRDDPQAQSVYDTYVMYRTFVLALPCAWIGVQLARAHEMQLCDHICGWLATGVLTLIFVGAWRLQRRYLGELIEAHDRG